MHAYHSERLSSCKLIVQGKIHFSFFYHADDLNKKKKDWCIVFLKDAAQRVTSEKHMVLHSAAHGAAKVLKLFELNGSDNQFVMLLTITSQAAQGAAWSFCSLLISFKVHNSISIYINIYVCICVYICIFIYIDISIWKIYTKRICSFKQFDCNLKDVAYLRLSEPQDKYDIPHSSAVKTDP